ncbi:aldehyde oxidase and xanthine dehydrogenase, molybdopterin binding domain protein [Ancylostoma duodenale]|uniref:Aldehyde oxidase and xanthine dehydrogenase, molybdopterin binding domain protein n=1 Tax=Ancylostoma duodenale TaxID=51022 RepID=A0A0C2CAB4_9BILA|nr:aldehyde oxidase and xanthine dehydrogenase, molybdopterin binding domain protein [Ancylostoma duodenale]
MSKGTHGAADVGELLLTRGGSQNDGQICYNSLSKHTDELLEALNDDIGRFSEMPDFDYRRSLAHAALLQLVEQAADPKKNSDPQEETPIETLQLFTEWSRGESDACGRPLATQSSDRYTTGEAAFVGDLKVKDLGHAAFVLSTQAHAKISEIDTSLALKEEGVYGFVSIKDIPAGGTNNPGSLPHNVWGADDTPVFSGDEVKAIGQVIGMIVAKDVNTARRAAKLVNVKYHLELPAILKMEDAIQQKSYLADPWIFGVEQNAVNEALSKSEIVLEGTTRFGGQEHSYMETQSCVAIPGEDDEWIIHASTQSPALVQFHTSAALGIPAHKVIVRVKRVGGAFGGKCTQSLPPAVCAAVAANALKRPVSVVMSRTEDMLSTGKRHPAMVKYKVGIDHSGVLKCAHLRVYLDGGFSKDMSGMIREMNFNPSGGTCLLGNEILNDNLLDCWRECLKLSDFSRQREEVDEFNKNSVNIKRGIAMGTTRMGMTHAGPYEQASALVQIYLDGTVAISIGGVEMGQGLNTKCLQVASRALNLPLSMITIIESGTDKTCNAPETGGSQNADIHGKAVQACCDKLLEGIGPILKEEKDWKKAVMKAFHQKLPLQASEHIRIERQQYGIPEESPTYHTTGAACVLSEIDCRTGEHKLLFVDIVLDVGRSLNPAIDIGQIEGAFMQCYGNMTCEELTWDKNGKLVQDSLYKYKIPTPAMTPRR